MELSHTPSSLASYANLSLCPLRCNYPRTNVTTMVTGRLLYGPLHKSSQNSLSTEFQGHNCCLNFAPHRISAARVRASPNSEADRSNSVVKEVLDASNVFWRFLRPYSIKGTLVGYPAMLAREWMQQSISPQWTQLSRALVGLLALLCADSYTTCINQIFDLEIDKINKPDLPLAAGEISNECAWLLVLSFLVMGVSIARVLKSEPFTFCVYGLFLVGTMYSAPPFSMKRSTVGAIVTIALKRGCLFALGGSSAAKASLGLPFAFSKAMTFFLIFTTIHASVIAVVKDLSDVEGDKKFNVPTLATIIGIRKVALIGCGILLLNYVGAIMASVYMPQMFKRSIAIPAHTFLALCLIFKAWKLDKGNYQKEESREFNEFVWKLLYAEYIIFPFI